MAQLRHILLLLLILLSQTVRGQVSAIDSLANKYRNWYIGEGLDYSRMEIRECYTKLRNAGIDAKNLPGYDLLNPGPVWNLTLSADRDAYVGLVEDKMLDLVLLYHVPGPPANPNPDYHSITLRDTILSIFNYLKAKGINAGTNYNMPVSIPMQTLSIQNSVALRAGNYATSVFLMKNELIAAGEFTHHMDALQQLTAYIDPDNTAYTFTYPGFNTDVIRATVGQRFCYVLAQDDLSTTRVADMAYLKNFVNNALQISYGWSDCIRPDFITYHHRGAYPNSYGQSALLASAMLNLLLKNSSYELSASAQSNIKKAVMTYLRFCIDFTQPRTLTGRLINNTGPLDGLRAAMAYFYVADTIANADAGREFTRLWSVSASASTNLRRFSSWGKLKAILRVLDAGLTPAPKLTAGQFSFPYAGLSVHKYNGYQASAKGTSKHIWQFENGDAENLFGQYASAGALELMTSGSPATHDNNGLPLNGWDWAHIPGTTVANVPFSVMANSTMRLMNGKEFLAHASLDSNGVFAMDYRDINSVTLMTALKSIFFFKDKILCLGSNIKNNSGTYPIHTTLFQTAFAAGNTSLVNGNTASGSTYTFSQTGGPLWATDAMGNGYVLPASPYNNQAVAIQRANQTSRNHNNTANTTGDFAKAYIDHGIAPSAASYQYAIVLKGGAATQDLANNFSSYFSVLQQDSLAHIVKYVPDSVFSYVVFDTTVTLAYDLLMKANRPAVVMTQLWDEGNKLKVSLTNPNLGLLARGESYITYNQISVPAILYRVPQTEVVKITLQGTWALDGPYPNVSVAANGSNTDVSFATKNGITELAGMIRQVPLPLGLTHFRAFPEKCATLLTWQRGDKARDIKNIAVERSPDGSRWIQLALLPPDAGRYRDETAGPAFYRLAMYDLNATPTYSPVLRSYAPDDCLARSVKVYPNPAGDVVYIAADKVFSGKEIVRITDGRGAGVPAAISFQGSKATIDLKGLSPGIYFIEAMGTIHKILKK